jgi:Tfp pilus assembly protein PilX
MSGPTPEPVTESRRPAGETGFAMISALMIMVIVLLVSAIGATAVVRSFDETNRDRSSTTAFSAADAALDIVTWRMNKQLVYNEIMYPGGYTATGTTQPTLLQLGCADINGSGIVQVQISASVPSTCTLTVSSGNGPTATCTSALAVTVNTTNFNTLASIGRNLICSATVHGVTRRLFTRADLSLLHAGGTSLANPSSVWKRTSWQECSVNASDPCPPT